MELYAFGWDRVANTVMDDFLKRHNSCKGELGVHLLRISAYRLHKYPKISSFLKQASYGGKLSDYLDKVVRGFCMICLLNFLYFMVDSFFDCSSNYFKLNLIVSSLSLSLCLFSFSALIMAGHSCSRVWTTSVSLTSWRCAPGHLRA